MKVLHRPKAISLLLGLTLTLTACGGGSGGKASDRSVKGGKLTYAVDAEPVNLDPHASAQAVTAFFARPVLDSLVAMDDKGSIHPWLATSWEISADEKTYSLSLRENVTFTDGTPFDAKAVKANLDHIVDPKTKSEMAAGYIEPYKETKVTGKHSVEISFTKPHAPFLSSLSTAYFGMQSPESLKKGASALAKKLVGTGPFVMDDFTPRKGAAYTRNEDYDWAPTSARHQGSAHLEKLEFKVITEDSGRLGALTSGQADAVANLAPSAVSQLKRPQLRVEKREAPGGTYSYYPNTSRGPFKDRRVREAFRDGIDFKTVVEKVYFGEIPRAASPLSPSTVGYDKKTAAKLSLDPKRAASLLDEAGWDERDGQGYRTKDGERLTVHWPFVKSLGSLEQRGTLGEQIQAEAKKLGFEVKFDYGTLNELNQQYLKGDYDLMDLSWQRAEGDALRNIFHSDSISTPEKFGQNVSKFNDKQVDGWLEDALATTNQQERADLYAKVQDKVASSAAAFPIYVISYLMGAAEHIQGIGWDPQAYPTFYDAWTSKK